MSLFVEPINALRGFHLHVGGNTVVKFFRFAIFIADEVALKDSFGFKGASGVQICPLCTNIVAESSNLHHFSSTLQPSTSVNPAVWQRCSDASMFAKIAKLHQSFGTISKGAFEELEKSLGWLYIPSGFMGDGMSNPFELTPASMIFYDYLHTLFANGVYDVEVGGLMGHLKSVGILQGELHEFLKSLTWPSSVASKSITGQMVFRKKQEGNFKCSESECLGIYMGIRTFLLIKMPQLQEILQVVGSYLALAELIDVLQAVRRGRRKATDLAHSITVYVHAHQQAYSNTLWVPKFHYLQHIAGMISHHEVVVGCFVHERKHRVAKKFAENIRGVGENFESSILKEVLYMNVQDLSDKDFE